MTVTREGWPGTAVGLVVAITAFRLVALRYNRTDLFVDESQYWLWGQALDFGYYSKPPLIAWVIRAVTELAGSDSAFWVRAPGSVLHGTSALVLGATAKRLYGPRAAFWVALCYVTTPFAALGSLLLSTDTIMAPFFIVALYGWVRLAQDAKARWAVLAGAAAGFALLSKYAAVYFLLGAALTWLAVPSTRPRWQDALIFIVSFLIPAAPNLVWNLTHDLTTLQHTADNIGWIRNDNPAATMSVSGLGDFIASQFLVFGPGLFAAFLWAVPGTWAAGGIGRALTLFSVPIILIVCAQALMGKAYANWAVAAYFAGAVFTVPILLSRFPRLLAASVALNGVIAVALPLATITAPVPDWHGAPLLKRYLGRAQLSRDIIGAAREFGAEAIYANDRDVLADLFYTGRDAGILLFAPRANGRAHNYYEQTHPLKDDAGVILFVLGTQPSCAGTPVAPVRRFQTRGGAYQHVALAAYLLPEECRERF